jgi:uncharacterized delta-60 repeat protein
MGLSSGAVRGFFSAYVLAFGVSVLSFMSFSQTVWAAPGDLDPTFGSGGIVSYPLYTQADASAWQPSSGKLLVGVSNGPEAGPRSIFIVRLNSDGTGDSTFGTIPAGGSSPPMAEIGCDPPTNALSCRVTSIVVQSDGKIVLGGYVNSGIGSAPWNFYLARLNENGTVDTTFGTNGVVKTDFYGLDDIIYSLVLVPTSSGDPGHPGQKIVAAGHIQVPGTFRDFGVARYHTNGTLDTSFGFGGSGKVVVDFFAGDDQINQILRQPDGKLLAIGRANNQSIFRFDFALVRLNANGTLDNTFDGDGKVTTTIVAGNNTVDDATSGGLQSDNKIIAAGYAGANNVTSFGIWTVVRYNSNGSLDTTFDSDGKLTIDFEYGNNFQRIFDVAIQPNDKIVTVGSIGVIGGSAWAIARFNSNGTLDTSFGGCDGKVKTDLNEYGEHINAVVIQPTDQKIVAAGAKGLSISSSQMAVGRYEGGDQLTPCNAPTNLRAMAVPTNQINLTWQDATNNEDGFKIERKTGAGGTYSEIATVGANVTNYSDNTGLSFATEYYYRVRAYNSVGNGLYSNEDATNTGCLGAQEGFETGNFSQFPWVTGGVAVWYVTNVSGFPNGPHSGAYYTVTGGPVGSGQLTYLEVTRTVQDGAICFYRRHWTTNGISYLRFLVDGNLVQAWTGDDVPYTFTSFTIPAGTYTFRWELLKNSNGDPSGVIYLDDITFPPSNEPLAPSNLSTTPISGSQVNLSWTDNSSNEDGFKIERKTGTGGTYSEITTVGANVTAYSDTGLGVGVQYCYRARAYNGEGNSTYSNESCATTLSPPNAPTNLNATAISGNQINLSWTDNSNNETGFKVERKTGIGGTYSQIATVGTNITTYSNTSLAAGTEYCYRVRATNANGDSAYSNESCTTTLGPPNAPSNLSATAISSSQINLSWTDNSNNETGFKIERKLGTGGTFSQIATVGINNMTYANTGLTPGTEYCYQVRAYNANGDSTYTNTSCAITLPPIDTPAMFRVARATGNVHSDGSYNCGLPGSSSPVPPCFNSGTGADLAEFIHASEALDYGDVIEPNPNKPKHYRKVRSAYSTGVAGVISTQPGMTMAVAPNRPLLQISQEARLTLAGASLQLSSSLTHSAMPLLSLRVDAIGETESAMAMNVSVSQVVEHRSALTRLALLGRVSVKATTENGAIRAGDLLVSSSKAGYAMRCADAKKCEGAVIGKALETLNADTGMILMLIVR